MLRFFHLLAAQPHREEGDFQGLRGADLEKYGPFKVEDIATIPYENAQ